MNTTPLLSAYSLLLFDLDDSLINTKAAYKKAQMQALAEVFTDWSPQLLEQARPELLYFTKTFGSGHWEDYFGAFLQNRGVEQQQRQGLVPQLVACYRRHFWQNLQIFPGVMDLLPKLKASHQRLGLVSNGERANQEKKLSHLGLLPWFEPELILISGDFPPHCAKPSAHMMHLALQRSGLAPQDCLYFGNTAEDMLAAHQAGLPACFVAQSCQPDLTLPPLACPDWVLSSFLALG